MGALQQYGLLLGLSIGAVGLVLSLFFLTRAIGRTQPEPGKDVPATAGELSRNPVWVRYHAHYYGYALLFLAFDMEMAYMYPWAVVYLQEGMNRAVLLGEVCFFLAVLGLGLAYVWKKGALEWD